MNVITDAGALGSLHDLVLVGIELDWPGGVASIELRDHDGAPTTVVMHGLRRFDLARAFEWGPSDSVNAATVVRPGAGEVRLDVEMQSGDPIVAVGARLEVRGGRSPQRDPSAFPIG